MEEFDFKNSKQYELFEKALQGQDVTEMLRQIQEEDLYEDDFEIVCGRQRRKYGKLAQNPGDWEWMDQEERWDALENAGYDPEEYN